MNAFETYETYMEKYPEMVVFAFGGVDSEGKTTVCVRGGDHISREWTEYFDKGKNYDGEFQHVLKRKVDLEFPFKEGFNGGEGIKRYLINKKYYDKTVHTEAQTRFYNTSNGDSLMRSEKSIKWLDNAIGIAEYRLSIMEADLRKYSPKGKDGLAMSYAILGGYYIRKKQNKIGLSYTGKAWRVNPAEPRVYRNILMLFGIAK